MPFIAYGGDRPLAGLGHFCSVCNLTQLVNDVLYGWRDDHGPIIVGAMVKIQGVERCWGDKMKAENPKIK